MAAPAMDAADAQALVGQQVFVVKLKGAPHYNHRAGKIVRTVLSRSGVRRFGVKLLQCHATISVRRGNLLLARDDRDREELLSLEIWDRQAELRVARALLEDKFGSERSILLRIASFWPVRKSLACWAGQRILRCVPSQAGWKWEEVGVPCTLTGAFVHLGLGRWLITNGDRALLYDSLCSTALPLQGDHVPLRECGSPVIGAAFDGKVFLCCGWRVVEYNLEVADERGRWSVVADEASQADLDAKAVSVGNVGELFIVRTSQSHIELSGAANHGQTLYAFSLRYPECGFVPVESFPCWPLFVDEDLSFVALNREIAFVHTTKPSKGDTYAVRFTFSRDELRCLGFSVELTSPIPYENMEDLEFADLVLVHRNLLAVYHTKDGDLSAMHWSGKPGTLSDATCPLVTSCYHAEATAQQLNSASSEFQKPWAGHLNMKIPKPAVPFDRPRFFAMPCFYESPAPLKSSRRDQMARSPSHERSQQPQERSHEPGSSTEHANALPPTKQTVVLHGLIAAGQLADAAVMVCSSRNQIDVNSAVSMDGLSQPLPLLYFVVQLAEACRSSGEPTLKLRGLEKLVCALVERRADVNAVGEDGSTPLMCACYDGLGRVVKNLIDARADVTARKGGVGGATALTMAIGSPYATVELVRTLLDAPGGDSMVNVPGANAWAPLCLAAMNGQVDTVQCLCQRGADVGFVNGRGSLFCGGTALDALRTSHVVAARRHRSQIEAILVSFGATTGK